MTNQNTLFAIGNNYTHRLILSAPSSPTLEHDKIIEYLKDSYRVKEVDLKYDCVPKGLAIEFEVKKINLDSL